MLTEKQPLISIAMTVFNAASFLAKSIESLLAQDYKNFELIISDNASEDGSSDICQEFAKRDNRIQYYRNTTNMGPARNSYKAADLCSGDFIMPAADHDMYHPNFISRLLELLQQDESVVLAYSRSVYIDENDKTIELMPDVVDTRGLGVCQRFSKIIWEFGWMNMVYGLYRTEVFKTVWHASPTIGADHVMIAKLCLLGSIAQIDEPLFYRRRNRPEEDTQECTKRQMALFVGSNYEALIPWTRLAYEHLNVVSESKLSDKEKELLYEEVRKCFPARFGDLMHNEALQLLSEGPKILLNAKSFPNMFGVVESEIARVALICRFFYPDIVGLDTLIASNVYSNIETVKNQLEQSDSRSLKDTKSEESVSVVIPTHNRAYIILRAVRSVLDQTYPIHEIVIVDDGSTDDTDTVIQQIQQQFTQVKYYKIPKSGAQAARNEGVRKATGAWIAFLDSDDEYLPNKIEKQMDVAKREKVSVVHCECYVKRGDQLPVLFGTPAISGNIYQAVLRSSGPTFPALLVRKKVLEAISLLDLEVPSFQEWDTVIRLAKDNAFGYVPEPLYVYYCHDGETISKNMKRHACGYAYIVDKHAIDILLFAGKEALVNHYRSLVQQCNDYGLPDRAKVYAQKLVALNAN
jgi:glycosyltransferase involved in cell wall biosynthesis